VIGTLYYMSPEQCNGEELDARADVYSLGAMLYEMLTGGPPFRSNNFAGLISKHLHEPPPHFPPSLGVPPAIESVCLRALAKNREHRQPDAIAFGRDLQKAFTEPLSYQPAASVTTQRSPLRWIIAAAGVFVALIVIVGAGIAIQFGMNRMQKSRDLGININQVVTQNSTPVDLRGTWAGTYGPMGTATELTINNQKGNSLDGVLEQGAIRVAFKGVYDWQLRTLTMTQTEVLSGDGWNLGEDVGKISEDGKKMSGTGKDPLGESLGITYQFSFTKK
jgi:serine/threonine protein kinase